MKKSIGQFKVTTIDLLRHGDCEGGDIFRGRTDVALSELGWTQMQAAVERCRSSEGSLPWEQIYASPLRRCAAFAQSLSTQESIPLLLQEDLRELSFGQWEGHQVKEVVARDPEGVKRFYQAPDLYAPPEGESLTALQARVVGVWQHVLDQHLEGHVLLVFHGAAMRALIMALLQMPLANLSRLEIPFAGMYRFHVYTDETGHRPALAGATGTFVD